MSKLGMIKQTAAVVVLIQDVQALRVGCPHYGLEVKTAQEVADEYRAQTDGRNAFYRVYDNQNHTPDVIRQRMNSALTMATRPEGYNAEYVIRSIADKNQFQVGLVRNAQGQLMPMTDLYNTGRGLARLIMARELFEITGGHLHGEEYPPETYQQLARMHATGRSILDLEQLGHTLERLPGEGDPLFVVRMGNNQSIELGMQESGGIRVHGKGFTGPECEGPINRILSAMGRTMEDVVPSEDIADERVLVTQTA